MYIQQLSKILFCLIIKSIFLYFPKRFGIYIRIVKDLPESKVWRVSKSSCHPKNAKSRNNISTPILLWSPFLGFLQIILIHQMIYNGLFSHIHCPVRFHIFFQNLLIISLFGIITLLARQKLIPNTNILLKIKHLN